MVEFLRAVKMCVGSIQYGGIETFWDRKLRMNFCLTFLFKKFQKFQTIYYKILLIKTYIIQNLYKCFNAPGSKIFQYVMTKICPRGQKL